MNESSRKRGKALRRCLAIPFGITASLSSAAQAQQEAPAQEPVEKASSEPVELLASFSPAEINSHWHGPIKGRSVSIAKDEAQQKKFRKLQTTKSGRETLRARVAVEHSLAPIAARKGDQARYLGVTKNLFDLRRTSAIQNLEALHRLQREAA